MSQVGQKERITQNRVVKLFREQLEYRYLENLPDDTDNRNIFPEILGDWLALQGHSAEIISKAISKFEKAATITKNTQLYDANKAAYKALRYGVEDIKVNASDKNRKVYLIDWKNPENNDFAIAEEVSIKGVNDKRPDIVLYVNGIALGVLELKRASVSVEDGIRQNLDNQKRDFIESFFTTQQLVMAGNDTNGLRYGTLLTPEKYYLTWKEQNPDWVPGMAESEKFLPNDSMNYKGNTFTNPLDTALLRLCNKRRFLELIHDFIVFDSGIKKTCRQNQYFGIKAAQERIRQRQGGIVWHTQGSGKSLTMVWLAKWIRENVTDARVLIITDRVELDDQIEKVFKGVEEKTILRSKDGHGLISDLNNGEQWLMCSLVHKFGRFGSNDDEATDDFIKQFRQSLPADFKPKGDIFVFVDECHRTQSGKLHDAMKVILPNAMFIGFTGTPLLKKDKRKSIEVFGSYIHTYKFTEAVNDGVVLDLRYEARDIDQYIASKQRVDEWFERKTSGLSEAAKRRLKQKWGTMQRVLSSKDRLHRIVTDIATDFDRKQRLREGRGNAMLVCSSISQACKTYELFNHTDLKGKCAIVTSYKPSASDIKGEETGEGLTEKLLQYDIYRQMIARFYRVSEDEALRYADQFESDVKEQFVDEPGRMQLLIVVDKLLTGFDAPSATYLYIDKKMQDHGLFQAICRVNRLDGDEKEYGYIIDYRDLFKSLEGAIKDYTSGALDGFDAGDIEGLLTDRLKKGRERLDETLETVRALCEEVPQPRELRDYLAYFVGDSAKPDEVIENEPKRAAFYKAVSSLVRAYGELVNDILQAGYSKEEAAGIKEEVLHYEQVKESVMIASSDFDGIKRLEPAMRQLLDDYIRADDSEKISDLDDMNLIQLIVERGDEAIDSLPKGIRKNQESVAETIENNMRRVIIDEQANNPRYYEKMSELLDNLVHQRKTEALNYKKYLEQVKALLAQVTKATAGSYPASLDTEAKRTLYDNLDNNEELALKVDRVMQENAQESWHESPPMRRLIYALVGEAVEGYDGVDFDQLMSAIKGKCGY